MLKFIFHGFPKNNWKSLHDKLKLELVVCRNQVELEFLIIVNIYKDVLHFCYSPRKLSALNSVIETGLRKNTYVLKVVVVIYIKNLLWNSYAFFKYLSPVSIFKV